MKNLIFLLLLPALSYGQNSLAIGQTALGNYYDGAYIKYTLNGVTLTQKKTSTNIGYWEWGTGPNVVIFLHGVDQRGNGTTDLEKLLSEGPFGRNGWQTFTWKYPDIFKRTDLTILTPQLPTSKSTWEISYINQFLDEVLQGRPFMLMGWSLGGGGALRYANQIAPKYVPTMVVGLSSAINEKGTNLKIPYWLAHSTNDGRVNVAQTDNFASGIPNFDQSRYIRLTSGDHWGPLALCDASSGIYNEFVEIAKPITPPTQQEGKIVRIGQDIYAVFGNEKIKLN